MATTYYKAVGGITDGMSYHTEGTVFVGTDAINDHFARTGGKDGDRVLYVKATETEYDDYRATVDPTAARAPSGIVGFDGTGLTGSQTNEKGEPLKADPEAGKPTEGEPAVEPTVDEAKRRLLAAAQGGGGAPKAEVKVTQQK